MKGKIKCWFRHKWSQWGLYEYDSDVECTWLGRLVCKQLSPEIPALQIRTCERCGKEERHDFRLHRLKARPEIKVIPNEWHVMWDGLNG